MLNAESIHTAEKVTVLGGADSRSWRLALQDIVSGALAWQVWGLLGWNDIRQRYRRSVIGPFWLTFSMGVTIASVGTLYAYLFKMPTGDYIPFFAVGMIVWTFLSGVITDSCLVFIQNEGLIKHSTLPKSIHVTRLIWRNFLIFLHHLMIYVPVVIIFKVNVGLYSLLALIGLIIIGINGFWMGLLLGITCARFRDIPQIVINFLQFIFFITPIMWKKEGMSKTIDAVVAFNPFYYFLEAVRAPLLGNPLDLNMLIILMLITVGGFLLTFFLFARYRARIPYWM